MARKAKAAVAEEPVLQLKKTLVVNKKALVENAIVKGAQRKSAMTKPVTKTEEPQLETLLDIEEVMATLGLSRPMVYKLIREEGLPTVTFGDRRKVVPSLLTAWVMQRAQSGM